MLGQRGEFKSKRIAAIARWGAGPQMVKVLHRAIVVLSSGGLVAGAAAVVGMSLLITLTVAGRYFFNKPINWVPEITGYLLIVIVFWGLADGVRNNRHIRIELITPRLPARVRDGLEVVTLALALAFLIAFTWQAWITVNRSLADRTVDYFSILHIRLWIPQLLMVIGLVLGDLAVLARLVQRVRAFLWVSLPRPWSGTGKTGEKI